MATSTPNLGLVLPGINDPANISVLNDNFSDIDTAIGKKQSVTISSGASENISLESAGRYFLITCAANANLKCVAIVSTNNSGNVGIVTLNTASAISFDTSATNVLGISNSANIAVDVFIQKLN